MIGKSNSRLFCWIFLALSFSVSAQTDEEQVGKAAVAQILGSATLVQADFAQQYVNLMGHAIAKASGANYKWRFGVIQSDSVNAFAMPGGYVLVSSGLLKSLESEDELAFVVAHEVAHVARRHHYQVVQRQRLAEQAAKGLQTLAQDSDTAKLAQASGQIYARGLDKSAEFEADRLGVEYMTKVGYDPAAALSVLEKLQRMKGNDPRTELLFSTHPSPAERLDMLSTSGIDQLPRPRTATTSARSSRFQKFLQSL